MSDQDTTHAAAGRRARAADAASAEQPEAPAALRDDRMIAGVAGGLGTLLRRRPADRPDRVRDLDLLRRPRRRSPTSRWRSSCRRRPRRRRAVPAAGRALALACDRRGIGLVVIALSWGIFDDGPLGRRLLLRPGSCSWSRSVAARRIVIARRAGGGSGGGRAGGVAGSRSCSPSPRSSALSIVALGAAWAGATGHGVAVARSWSAIGVMLVLAAFSGGARWLIAPALALAIPLGAVAAADISFGDGIGERDVPPAHGRLDPRRRLRARDRPSWSSTCASSTGATTRSSTRRRPRASARRWSPCPRTSA